MNNGRKHIVRFIFILTGLIFLVKLLFIQVFDSRYVQAADNNIILKEIIYPYRGLIYDRNNQLIVYNEPQYEMMITKKDAVIQDTLHFCNVFGITKSDFEEKVAIMKKSRGYSPVKPFPFFTQISHQEFAKIQDYLVDFPGFVVQARTTRKYTNPIFSNALGYVSEINKVTTRKRFFRLLQSTRLYRSKRFGG